MNLFHQSPLYKIASQDYIQQSQKQQLLQAIIDQLPRTLNVILLIETLLSEMQSDGHSPSYAAGNLINLLIQLGESLVGRDLSYLPLWEVDLAANQLHQVNLSGADLSRTRFAHAFGGVTSIAFSPMGDRFVSGHEDGIVSIWDCQPSRQLHILTGHKGWVWNISWSKDGNHIISASEDQTLRVWDAQTGQCLQVLADHGRSHLEHHLPNEHDCYQCEQ